MVNSHKFVYLYSEITRIVAVSIFVIFTICCAYSFNFDCEYIGPDKRYEMERENYYHTHDVCEWNRDFPSFSDWMQIQEQRERDMKEWLGVQSLACFGTLEEYQRAEAEYSARMYPNLNRDADRAGPTAAECPQAMERKGPND